MSDVYVDNIRVRDADCVSVHGCLSANESVKVPGITFADGSEQTTRATAYTSPATETVFTSSGTWTRPSGVSLVQVVCIGAGGTGGTNNGTRGHHGGNGAYAMDWVDVSGDNTVSVTVGTSSSGPGNAYTSSPNVGGATGGASSFGAYVIGGGGAGGSSVGHDGAQSGPGSATGDAGNGSLASVLDLTSLRPSGAYVIVQTTPTANSYGGGGYGGKGYYGGNNQYSWNGHNGIVIVRVVG